MEFPRLLDTTLRAAAAAFPVVAILGARQVGKTTLARAVFPAHRYVDLEDPRTAQRWRADARFELDSGAPQHWRTLWLKGGFPDAQATRGWIVDQAPGIERVSDSIARAGFKTLIRGTP